MVAFAAEQSSYAKPGRSATGYIAMFVFWKQICISPLIISSAPFVPRGAMWLTGVSTMSKALISTFCAMP